MVVPTRERIRDDARLRELRAEAPGTPIIVEFLDEAVPADVELLRQSLCFPDSIVASDAMPVFFPAGGIETRDWPLPAEGRSHPRTAGTFCRALRTMVRESGDWTWTEAFRRCAWLPAQVLSFAPAATRKGHLGVGADADIVVIDPSSVSDRSTYDEPLLTSAGVSHLFVLGEAVVRDGSLVVDAYPGQPLRAGSSGS